MTTQYCIQSSGYEMPDPMTLTEAKSALTDALVNSLQRARRVSKQAHKHKIDAYNYFITLGPDKNSQLWQTFTITKF